MAWVDENIIQPIEELVEEVIEVVQEATTITGSIEKDLSFRLPDPESSDPVAKTSADSSIQQVDSPWGSALLLKSFGDESSVGEDGLSGYLNVYCVGCGASGQANIQGRAAWTPFGGFTQGEVELNGDLTVAFKLGIDAQIKYQQDFSATLLQVGLPGLTYGVVVIGPYVGVGAEVSLLTSAQGRILAGAEMGITNAHVVWDFVTSENSKTEGWEPYFKPVFEAEGEIVLSASLGLPISLGVGLKIASWEKGVSLIDTPSIKAMAQVAASASLQDGALIGGFKEINGCTGISTQLSWRNQVTLDLLGITTLNLFDTEDRTLAEGCIE